jgi:hypothetical protein
MYLERPSSSLVGGLGAADVAVRLRTAHRDRVVLRDMRGDEGAVASGAMDRTAARFADGDRVTEPDDKGDIVRCVPTAEMPECAVNIRGCLNSIRELPESGEHRFDAYRVGYTLTVWWTGEAWAWLPTVEEPSFHRLQERVCYLEERLAKLERAAKASPPPESRKEEREIKSPKEGT